MIGQMTVRIIERQDNKCVKLEAEGTPFPVLLWIQMLPTPNNPYESKMKLTVNADFPFYMKPMVSKPLKEGIEKLSEVLSKLPYNQF